jgi:UDP-2-acetamido-2,6-beta-L-arabino-hexul-4-ose reductase
MGQKIRTMKVLITGSNGFIGKNLKLYLSERKEIEVICFNKKDDESLLPNILKKVDFIFHLAGVNRSKNIDDFQNINSKFTERLCGIIKDINRKIPIVFTSSIRAEDNNPYGKSKQSAEKALINLKNELGLNIYLFRLLNVFGKWSKPNYNSVVATFCYNITREIPIRIDDENKTLELVYIDDVIKRFVELIDETNKKTEKKDFEKINPTYHITIGDLAKQLYAFKKINSNLVMENVGTGLTRALYSTFISYLPKKKFSYTLPVNKDYRGSFVEILKTPNYGQFSFFTAKPGITRGSHYHHTKTEKFLVVKGKARFKFFHMDEEIKYELTVNNDKPEIVETIPGWSHSITNIGEEELIVLLWANEIFDPNKPDTYAYKI